MTPEDQLTYLPVTSDPFDLESAEPFLHMVNERAAQFIEDQRKDDMPLSLLEFAIDIVYETGRRDGIREISRSLRDLDGKATGKT